MDHLEIEVKFHLTDPGAVRTAVRGLGGTSRGRAFETNLILDNGERALSRNHALLRLRQAEKTWLTFKNPPDSPDTTFKIRREREVEVSDFATTRQILKKLGFRTVRIYEKWRETFEFGQAQLCLDTLPFGDFLEIEGAREEILNLTERLGFDWAQRSVLNYHELFELVKTDQQLTFMDITFANFEGVGVEMTKLKALFEAGS